MKIGKFLRSALALLALGLLAPSTYAQTQVNSAQSSAQTAAWTSATGSNTAIAASVANMSTVEASFFVTGTISSGGIVFEVSDNGGTTWYPAYAVPQSVAPPATPINTYALTGSNQIWQVDVAGYNQFRIRLNPVITNTGTANIQWLASSMPSRPSTSAQENLVNVGGAPVVTGTGPGGAGVPRVTVSNDSTLALGPQNVSQFGSSNVVTGPGASGAGIPRVTISNDSTLAANQSVNVTQYGGASAVNGGIAGSQSSGGTSGNNTAITQNPDVMGLEADASLANPAAATNGNLRRVAGDLTGNVFVRPGGPFPFSCTVTITTATTTQCQAAPAAGFTAYVTHVSLGTTTAGTASAIQVKYGTGANCGTGTATLSTTYPNTVVGSVLDDVGQGALVPASANAICVTQTGTPGTTVAVLAGYIAP